MTAGRLVCTDGRHQTASSWIGPASAVDARVLARCPGPVLDVGCGPGRHTVALAEQGIPALGIDITAPALAVARPRGALVLERDVFDRIPAAGRWGSVLLLDGNLGIGGDPVALLDRCGDLVRPGGLIVVELVDADADPPSTVRARLEVHGRRGPWFGWTRVGTVGLRVALAGLPDLELVERWHDHGRDFVALRRRAEVPAP